MSFQKAKLFWHARNGQRQICYVPFNDDCEYYVFLKEYHDKGYKQIIITSELMSGLMRFFVRRKIFLYMKLTLWKMMKTWMQN